MSDIKINTSVSITASIALTEGQLRGLDALAGYGADNFFKAFYVKLGKAYMQPFERDMRELFSLIREQVPPALAGIEDARKALGLK